MRDRPNFSSLLVSDQVCDQSWTILSATSFGPVYDQDSVMEFGFKPTRVMVRLIQRLVSVSVCVTLVDSSYAHKMIELIFGRPFVKRFALCYGTVVCLCL